MKVGVRVRWFRGFLVMLLMLPLLFRSGLAVAEPCPHGAERFGQAMQVVAQPAGHEGCEGAQEALHAAMSAESAGCASCGACVPHGGVCGLPSAFPALLLPPQDGQAGFARWQPPVARYIGDGLERPPRRA